MSTSRSCLLAVVAATVAAASFADPGTEAAVRRWQELKYGMFIHFGMSTFTGREIDAGDRPSTTYNPSQLDVDQWISTAKAAGMKYAVLTSKHVAGHCLWDSRVEWRGSRFDYDVATSGNTTDVVRAFVDACGRYGLMPGLYWCMLDYHNNSVPQGPQWTKGELPEDFFQLAQDQLAELIARYPEVAYYWLDIPRAASAAQRRVLYDHIKRLRPGTIVLFNYGFAGQDVHGAFTIESSKGISWPTDVLNSERYPIKAPFTPEQTWQGHTYRLGYEHCDCLAKNWFWVEGDRPRPTRDLYRLYRDTVAAGGNLLLDVPPDRSGRIPEEHVKALMALKQMIDNPPPAPLNAGKPATASNVYKGQAEYGAAAAVDDSPSTRWATDDGVTNAWLEVDLGAPQTFGRAVISAAYPELDRIRAFRIEYRDGDAWKTAHEGGRIGADLAVSFPPVTARQVRLHITEATEGPTIWEFQLFQETAP
jgi:alpha-L-fucosidase